MHAPPVQTATMSTPVLHFPVTEGEKARLRTRRALPWCRYTNPLWLGRDGRGLALKPLADACTLDTPEPPFAA